MLKNYISILILAAISAFSINELSAQEKKEAHKVIVIEKSVDADGNVNENKVVKEGQEAKDFINKMNNEEGVNIWITDEGEEIDLDGKKHKMIKKQQYKIVKKDDDGNEETIEWNGEGEMPNEIKKALEEADIEISEHESKTVDVKVESEGGKSMIKIMKGSNGDQEEIELEFENGIEPEFLEFYFNGLYSSFASLNYCIPRNF